MNEVIKRNQSAAGNYSHDAICPRCHTPYDSHAYHKGMCGSCERIAQTKQLLDAFKAAAELDMPNVWCDLPCAD